MNDNIDLSLDNYQNNEDDDDNGYSVIYNALL